jgi:hypothetical protein
MFLFVSTCVEPLFVFSLVYSCSDCNLKAQIKAVNCRSD